MTGAPGLMNGHISWVSDFWATKLITRSASISKIDATAFQLACFQLVYSQLATSIRYAIYLGLLDDIQYSCEIAVSMTHFVISAEPKRDS